MSRYEKLFAAMMAEKVVTVEDKNEVLSEIFKTGGELMFAELERLYLHNVAN